MIRENTGDHRARREKKEPPSRKLRRAKEHGTNRGLPPESASLCDKAGLHNLE